MTFDNLRKSAASVCYSKYTHELAVLRDNCRTDLVVSHRTCNRTPIEYGNGVINAITWGLRFICIF